MFLKKIKSDALTLERSILVNSTLNDIDAIVLLIFIFRRVSNQLHLYHLINYSLWYNNNKIEQIELIIHKRFLLFVLYIFLVLCAKFSYIRLFCLVEYRVEQKQITIILLGIFHRSGIFYLKLENEPIKIFVRYTTLEKGST